MTEFFPYPLLTRDQMQHKINEFSRKGMPFFVLIRFDASAGYCIPKHEMDPRWIKVEFHSSAAHSGLQPILNDWQAEPVDRHTYSTRFDRVMSSIQRGDTFLINLTQPAGIHTSHSLEELFDLAVAPYKVWVKNSFVCFSPECFVKIDDGIIRTFPMKGTIDASLENAAERILADEKEKAEHATIVDLLRNDLSMVATDVQLNRYRYIDRIRTHSGELLQVSSEIQGTLPSDYRERLGDILFALLPAGSVSGAPKARTLEIISEVEEYDRGFYTGICGYFDGMVLDTAVMIRYVEQGSEGLSFKSGGGITFRSEMELEYQELIQKIYVPMY